MTLFETLNELKNFLNKNNINKEEFITKLLGAITKAMRLMHHATDKATFDDIVKLIAYYTADGDENLASLINSLINAYVSVAKSLGEENATYFKDIITYYLQK